MTQHASLPNVPEITADELRRELEAGRAVTVLDVRRTADWSEWSVPGSANSNGLAGVAAYHATPGSRVITVCGRGNSSRRAAQELIARGVNAASLKGGMRSWSLAWNAADVPGVADGVAIVQVRRTGKGCLSYLIVAGGAAAVIDPSVEAEVYVALARTRGATITAVLDTHVHAEQQRVKFPVKQLGDSARVLLGGAAIVALRTPGHTFESTCYAVGGAVLTGDTLFLDSVGRPDLKAGTEDETRERARLLHASLARLAALPGTTIILPGHTSKPVAFDGTALSASLDTVRHQARALLELGEAAFVDEVVSRIPKTPPNHEEIVRLNEAGAWPADPSELEAGANRCAIG
jgi:glyoxylase-like metal-dependent hydrolase (beta-lactamase superfamily II)/rhodanese-related sulfurtransferase